LNKTIVQTSKTLQEAYCFKLGDDVNISAAGTELARVESIILRDVTPKLGTNDVPEIEDRDLVYWEWYLQQEPLSKWFNLVSFQSPTRSGTL